MIPVPITATQTRHLINTPIRPVYAANNQLILSIPEGIEATHFKQNLGCNSNETGEAISDGLFRWSNTCNLRANLLNKRKKNSKARSRESSCEGSSPRRDNNQSLVLVNKFSKLSVCALILSKKAD